MPSNIDHEPRSNNSSTATRASTRRDERQTIRSFADLSSDSKVEFLTMVGYLFGVRVDCKTGPRTTASQVAFLKAGRNACFRETTELNTESVVTPNEREANYMHRGWPLSALSLNSPWIQSRISIKCQPNRSKESIVKGVVACRLQVDILLKDLSPVPEFEVEVREALAMSTRFETFQRLYQVFERWGDVIALSFDVGTSLTVTDLKSNDKEDQAPLYDFKLLKLMQHKTAKLLTQALVWGVDLDISQSCWVPETPVGHWSQVRVTNLAPITALLSAELQAQLSQLHGSLIAYRPLFLGGDTNNGYAFDDVSQALKTITSIKLHCADRVNAICVGYSDGTFSPQHGTSHGSASTFDLNVDEYISEVHIWGDSNGVSSIKFLTSSGRASHAYGGTAGTLAILSSTGGFLTAFAGKVQKGVIFQLQGIWRHDIRNAEPSQERKYSIYYGTSWGFRFDDMPLLEHSNAAISRIKVRAADRVFSIQPSIATQLTYTYKEGDCMVTFEGPHNGGTGGSEGSFDLSPGEYVTVIRGRLRPNVGQLCFATNLGRTSSVLGGGGGAEFVCQAPLSKDGKTMRLYSVAGRCGGNVDGLLFTWAVV